MVTGFKLPDPVFINRSPSVTTNSPGINSRLSKNRVVCARYRRIMVGLVLMFMWLWLLSMPLRAAELTVTLDSAESEMGKYFLADIRYQGPATDAEFNLSEWSNDFFLSLQNSRMLALEQGGIEKTASVRLYPRRSGSITLPSIAFAGAIAGASRVTVQRSVRNDIDATPELLPLQSYYWTDQAIFIGVDVALHDVRNRIDVDDFELEGFRVQALKPQRRQQQGRDIIQLQWMLLTPQKGNYQIELPAIHQRGRGRFRYHLPALNLTIKPLPAYLPATIPVGQIDVSSELVREPKQAAMWRISIEKDGYLPPHVEGFQTLFDALGLAAPGSKETTSQNGRVSLQYQLPVPGWYFASPNTIQIPYFDTRSGQLITLQHRLPVVWQVPSYVYVAGLFLLMIVIFYAGYHLNKVAELVRYWMRFRQQIQQADSAHSLRLLLTSELCSKTLGEWSAKTPCARAQQIAQDLNECCFARASEQKLTQIKGSCLEFFTLARIRRNVINRSSMPTAVANTG